MNHRAATSSISRLLLLYRSGSTVKSLVTEAASL